MHANNTVKSRWVILACGAILLNLLSSCTVKTTRRPLGSPDPIKIQDIRIAEGSDKTIIELESEEPILYTSFRLSNPDRLVIEMADVTFGQYQDEIKVTNGPVQSIVLASSGELDVSRLEFQLNGLVKTDVRPEGLNIVIEVTRIEQASGQGKPNQVEEKHEKSFIFFGEKEDTPPTENEAALPMDGIREEPLKQGSPELNEPLMPPPLVPPSETQTAKTGEEIPLTAPDLKPTVQKNQISTPTPPLSGNGGKPEETSKDPASPARFITAVRFIEGDPLQLLITSDGKLTPKFFFVGKKKDRLVIDFPGVQSKIKHDTIEGDPLLVKRVRVGRHPKKLRLVLDLNLPVTYSWDQEQNDIRVTIK